MAIVTLWLREVIRFYRQPSRVVGALASPLVFWLLMGSGIGKSFQSSSVNYLEYFFPGILLLILLFTAIFSTISLIEDRKEGFLQSVLVAPVSSSSFVLGKMLGGATLACAQGVLFLLLGSFIGISMTPEIWIKLLGILFLVAFALTGLGFFIAWQFQSIQGFHAVMNLFLMPLWILSGALFPQSGASAWIQIIMKWNPLTYGMALIRETLLGSKAGDLPNGMLSLAVTAGFALIMVVLSTWIASGRRRQEARA